jgi:hypothetical protein
MGRWIRHGLHDGGCISNSLQVNVFKTIILPCCVLCVWRDTKNRLLSFFDFFLFYFFLDFTRNGNMKVKSKVHSELSIHTHIYM